MENPQNYSGRLRFIVKIQIEQNRCAMACQGYGIAIFYFL